MKKDMGGAAHALALGRMIMAAGPAGAAARPDPGGGERHLRRRHAAGRRAGLAQGPVHRGRQHRRRGPADPGRRPDPRRRAGAGADHRPGHPDRRGARGARARSCRRSTPTTRPWPPRSTARPRRPAIRCGACRSGRATPTPLDSDVADIKNDPDAWAQAGSVTAALFLQAVRAGDGAWAHFDIFAWNPRKAGRASGGRRGPGDPRPLLRMIRDALRVSDDPRVTPCATASPAAPLEGLVRAERLSRARAAAAAPSPPPAIRRAPDAGVRTAGPAAVRRDLRRDRGAKAASLWGQARPRRLCGLRAAGGPGAAAPAPHPPGLGALRTYAFAEPEHQVPRRRALFSLNALVAVEAEEGRLPEGRGRRLDGRRASRADRRGSRPTRPPSPSASSARPTCGAGARAWASTARAWSSRRCYACGRGLPARRRPAAGAGPADRRGRAGARRPGVLERPRRHDAGRRAASSTPTPTTCWSRSSRWTRPSPASASPWRSGGHRPALK